MNTTVNNLGEVRPDDTPSVHDRTAPYMPGVVTRTDRIAAEAGRWLTYAGTRTRMTPAALTTKALQSACFSVESNASGFAVPTKLSGVREHQARLWALVRGGYGRYDELGLDTATTGGVTVTYDDDAIGEVQPKHAGWLRPLVPFGVRLYLAQVTGSDRAGYTLGVNVVVGHVGGAVERLLGALGDVAPSGDGRTGRSLPVFSVASGRGGGKEEPGVRRLRLVTPSEAEHGTPRADPDDVVLYRTVDGEARASVPHAPRHSPSGIEWGYAGSGPADLARSVLLALVPDADVERLYQPFKAEFVARVPYAGGLIRASEVRSWAALQPNGL